VLLLPAPLFLVSSSTPCRPPTSEIVHFQVTNLHSLCRGLPSTAAFFLDGVANYTLAGADPNKGSIYQGFQEHHRSLQPVPVWQLKCECS